INYQFPKSDLIPPIARGRTLVATALNMSWISQLTLNLSAYDFNEEKHQDCLNHILSRSDLDITVKDSDGWLPLHIAVLNERPWALNIFLEYLKDKKCLSLHMGMRANDITALDLALERKKANHVRVLLKYVADHPNFCIKGSKFSSKESLLRS